MQKSREVQVITKCFFDLARSSADAVIEERVPGQQDDVRDFALRKNRGGNSFGSGKVIEVNPQSRGERERGRSCPAIFALSRSLTPLLVVRCICLLHATGRVRP